jgi:tRNA1(Val) A37 N6-methylase TrmN6
MIDQAEIDDAALSVSIKTDGFFGGRLLLRQPARGHRAGTDAVLLAAAAPKDFAGLVLDAGSGVGAAGLALAAKRPSARLGLIENDAATADLARANLALNGMEDRGEVFLADLFSPPSRRAAGLVDESADLVISNPPFFDPRRARPSPNAERRRAHLMREAVTGEGAAPGGEGSGLHAWIAASLALVRPGGAFILIHRPESLGAILASLEGRSGAVAVLPIHARQDQRAIRILVRAVKASRSPLSIASALILHERAEFTALARAIHRGEAAIEW